METAPQKQLYIVLSQTGTVLSRLLKVITKAPYNHASISLSAELTEMYSFGRRRPYNPFWAGFVVENPHGGTFKRFPETEAMVFSVDISEEAYEQIRAMIDAMVPKQRRYHYNYVGLVLAAFKICYRPERCYYCSEFVKEVFVRHGLTGSEQLPAIVKPIHFLELPHTPIYQGKLKDYRVPEMKTAVNA